MRLRHQSFGCVAEVDAAITALLPMLNNRAFQKLHGCRASVFSELDAPALMPLPSTRYEIARFKTVRVHVLCGLASSVAIASQCGRGCAAPKSEGHRTFPLKRTQKLHQVRSHSSSRNFPCRLQ